MVDGWDKMDENKDVPKNGWFNGIEWEKWKGYQEIKSFHRRGFKGRRIKGRGIMIEI